jgi:hypothetical protein
MVHFQGKVVVWGAVLELIIPVEHLLEEFQPQKRRVVMA